MTPAPFTSIWNEKTHYLTQAVVRNQVVFVVVPNGVQPQDGHIFPTQREAITWLRDNGFIPGTAPNLEE